MVTGDEIISSSHPLFRVKVLMEILDGAGTDCGCKIWEGWDSD